MSRLELLAWKYAYKLLPWIWLLLIVAGGLFVYLVCT